MNTYLSDYMELPKHALELLENMSFPEPPLPEPVKTTEINSQCDLLINDKSSPDSTCLENFFFLNNKKIQSTENLFPNLLEESIQTLNDSDSQAKGSQESTHGQENDAAPNRINYEEFTEKMNLKFVETENKIQLSNEQIPKIPDKEFFVAINNNKESKTETKKNDQSKKKIHIENSAVLSDPKIHTTLNTIETLSEAIPTSSRKSKRANETLNSQEEAIPTSSRKSKRANETLNSQEEAIPTSSRKSKRANETLNSQEEAIPTSSRKSKRANETLNSQEEAIPTSSRKSKRFRQGSQERKDRNNEAGRKYRKKLNQRDLEIDNKIKSLEEEHNIMEMKVQQIQIEFGELRKLILKLNKSHFCFS